MNKKSKKSLNKNEVKMWAVVDKEREKGMGPIICGGVLGNTFVTYISHTQNELEILIKDCYAPNPKLTKEMLKGIRKVTVSW